MSDRFSKYEETNPEDVSQFKNAVADESAKAIGEWASALKQLLQTGKLSDDDRLRILGELESHMTFHEIVTGGNDTNDQGQKP